MAKDPAFLFYPGDWMGGTMILSRHQKGCYIDLLIAQFNNGPLSLESIKTILGQDQATWTVLASKFKQDSAGNYFNERLAAEIEKRRKFSESRKENGKNGGRKKALVKPYANHMDNHTENRDENEVVEEGTGETYKFPTAPPASNETPEFNIEHCLTIALADQRWVDANKATKAELEAFNRMLEEEGTYQKVAKDYKAHFARWKRKKGGAVTEDQPTSTSPNILTLIKNAGK